MLRCRDGREAFARTAIEPGKTTDVHGSSKEIEESNMFWWIIDLFLDRDWSDLLGVMLLIAALVVIAVFMTVH